MPENQHSVRQRYQKPEKQTDNHTESFMSGEALNYMPSSRHKLYVLILQSFGRFHCIHDIVFFRHAVSATGFSKPVKIQLATTSSPLPVLIHPDTPTASPPLLDLRVSSRSRMSLKLLKFLGGALVGMMTMSQTACNSFVIHLNGSMVCEVW